MKNYDNFIYEFNSVPGVEVNKKTTFEEDEEHCGELFGSFWTILEDKLDFIENTNNYINKKLDNNNKDAVALYNDKMRNQLKNKKAENTKTTPVEKKPVEAKPVEAKPVEAKPVETKPVETKPVETKPVNQAPVVTKPVTKTKTQKDDQQYTATEF